METKYRFLHTAATIFRVIGWIVLVVGVIFSILMGVGLGYLGMGYADIWVGVIYAILGILYSVILWVSFLAFADILGVLIDLEQNTRETAEHLRTGSIK